MNSSRMTRAPAHFAMATVVDVLAFLSLTYEMKTAFLATYATAKEKVVLDPPQYGFTSQNCLYPVKGRLRYQRRMLALIGKAGALDMNQADIEGIVQYLGYGIQR